MAKLTGREFAEKWARRLKGATADIRAGVERTDKNPMERAIAKKDKMKAHIVEAIDDGRWERGLRKVTLDEWKRRFIEKGLSRIPAGVDASADKVADFGEKLLAHIDEGLKEIEGMPDLTLEDSINRMTKFVRHMAKFKYK